MSSNPLNSPSEDTLNASSVRNSTRRGTRKRASSRRLRGCTTPPARARPTARARVRRPDDIAGESPGSVHRSSRRRLDHNRVGRTIALAFMFRHVPNLLTGGRLLLAAVFFVLLSYYQHSGRGDPYLLNTAFLIYLIALFTDFLDGYLARKWKVEGAFGRIVDPFVDKVLVLGSFIFFAGKNFVIQEERTAVVKTITGVVPWMVVLILSR